MRICIHKATKHILEMQSTATPGTLIQNALNAGYALGDIEEREVDQAGYEAAKAEDPNEVALLLTAQSQKAISARIFQEIIDTLPSWQITSNAINAAFPDLKQREAVKKIARVVYLLAKNEET